MASFYPSRKCLAVVGHPGMLDCIRIISPCADGLHWRAENGFLYGIEELRAWAPIPEWTGEVAE